METSRASLPMAYPCGGGVCNNAASISVAGCETRVTADFPQYGSRWRGVILLPACGFLLAAKFDGQLRADFGPGVIWLLAVLFAGAPIFCGYWVVWLWLCSWQDGLPLCWLRSPLSHYQITVNSSLPALPLFTPLRVSDFFARTDAAPQAGSGVCGLRSGRGGVTGTVGCCGHSMFLFHRFQPAESRCDDSRPWRSAIATTPA